MSSPTSYCESSCPWWLLTHALLLPTTSSLLSAPLSVRRFPVFGTLVIMTVATLPSSFSTWSSRKRCVPIGSSPLCLGSLVLSHVCLYIHLFHHLDHLDSDTCLDKHLPISSFLLPQPLPAGSAFSLSTDSSCFALAHGSSFGHGLPTLWHQALFCYLHITSNKSSDCDGSP